MHTVIRSEVPRPDIAILTTTRCVIEQRSWRCCVQRLRCHSPLATFFHATRLLYADPVLRSELPHVDMMR